jgi:hypothetical protein
MDILQTRNPTWGFFGTFGRHDEPDVAWALASQAIAKATRCSAKDVRTFLDSRRGRDFAEGSRGAARQRIHASSPTSSSNVVCAT